MNEPRSEDLGVARPLERSSIFISNHHCLKIVGGRKLTRTDSLLRLLLDKNLGSLQRCAEKANLRYQVEPTGKYDQVLIGKVQPRWR